MVNNHKQQNLNGDLYVVYGIVHVKLSFYFLYGWLVQMIHFVFEICDCHDITEEIILKTMFVKIFKCF